MKSDIAQFLRKACLHYHMEAVYIADNDTWFVHKGGRAIQTFTTKDFYQLPRRYRWFMFEPLLKQGLSHNLGERTKDGLFGMYKLGKKIA